MTDRGSGGSGAVGAMRTPGRGFTTGRAILPAPADRNDLEEVSGNAWSSAGGTECSCARTIGGTGANSKSVQGGDAGTGK